MDDLRHGVYWDVKPGQLDSGEEVDSGFATKADAEKSSASLLGFSADVRLLKTVEHDLPVEDPKFDKSQVFDSQRWCVVIAPITEP